MRIFSMQATSFCLFPARLLQADDTTSQPMSPRTLSCMALMRVSVSFERLATCHARSIPCLVTCG